MTPFGLVVRSDRPLSSLNGVGGKFREIFDEAGIQTVLDARSDDAHRLIVEAMQRLRQRHPDIAPPVWAGRGARVAGIMDRIHEAAWIGMDPPDEFACMICYNWLINPRRLPSGELVCYHCIHRWLVIQGETTSPYTRLPLSMADLVDESRVLRPLIRAFRDQHEELVVRRRRAALDLI